MQELSDVQSALVSDIARKQGFEEFKVHAESGTEKGDNYMGIITNVIIESVEKKLHLILKTSHADEKFRESVKIPDVYDHEIYVYEKLFPLIDTVQEELKIKYPFQGHAEIYGSYVGGNVECLVMGDMRHKHFKLWNRKVPMNAGHLDAVVREYAKLHSFGIVLSSKKPEIFEEIDKKLFDVWATDERSEKNDEDLKMFLNPMLDKLLKIVQNNSRAVEAVKKLESRLLDYYMVEIIKPEFKLTVLHEDCWCNNIMFQYQDPKDETKPDKVCFLDWQLSKLGSPAQDLVYYLFTSTDVDELKSFKHYLKIYHDTLSENLRSVGLDPEEVFPFSMLEEHIKHFALFGLMTAVMILQLIILDKDEAPDLSKMNDDFSAMFNMEGTNQQQYRDRILNLVLFLLDNELL